MPRELRFWIALVAGLAAALLASAGSEPGRTPPVYPNAASVAPLGIGDRVPSAPVRDLDGKPTDVDTLTRSGALLVFYRGGW